MQSSSIYIIGANLLHSDQQRHPVLEAFPMGISMDMVLKRKGTSSIKKNLQTKVTKCFLPSFPYLLGRQALPSKSRNYLITYPYLYANPENLQVGFDEQLKIQQPIQQGLVDVGDWAVAQWGKVAFQKQLYIIDFSCGIEV